MSLDSLKFLGVPQRKVDMEVLKAFIEDESPKRINFATHHKNALRRIEGNDKVVGKLVLPFDEPFECIANKVLSMDIHLFHSKFGSGFYRKIFSEIEYRQIEGFISQYYDLVFIRDTLDLSIALSMHETEPDVRTELGEHEFRVKYRSNKEDTSMHFDALVTEMQRRLDTLPFFKHSDYICAVPSNSPFMQSIIERLNGFDFVDISSQVLWDNKSGSLKNVETAEEKLEMIQSWGLRFDDKLDLEGKTVLLVDDMYQSGVTMQYIAMRMKEAGAARVLGMTLVKSRRN